MGNPGVGTIRIIINPQKANHIKKSITGLLLKIIGKQLRVTGLGNIDPEINYLIVSNYPGSYAGFALMNIFPDTSILVHSFLSRVPIVGFLLKSTGAIFVKRKKFGRSIQTIDELLKQGKNRSIIILPEGRRSPDGSIHRFRRGFLYILRNNSMDLLPITLSGFYSLKPLKRLYLDPDSDLEVVLHKPISYSTIESRTNEQIVRLTLETISKSYKQ